MAVMKHTVIKDQTAWISPCWTYFFKVDTFEQQVMAGLEVEALLHLGEGSNH